uniref:C2 domain-containing protein n=1 Tax=Trypanosoma vivax (strain Y486) TaxID=1055687 RepID=G0U6H5_TRYVY|nr:conserved hypothetical protein [Trypanosoma vivax Y486]
MNETVETVTRPVTVLLAPGVYPTTCSSTEACVSTHPPVSTLTAAQRFHKQRRLRRAMMAKEATMLELTRLLVQNSDVSRSPRAGELTDKSGFKGGDMNPECDIHNTVERQAPRSAFNGGACEAELQSLRMQNTRMSANEAAFAREREQLRSLINDLRHELEASGQALRDQTALARSLISGMSRQEPHRMAKSQREELMKRLGANVLSDTIGGTDRELTITLALEKIKCLEDLLALERQRCEQVEKQYTELQNMDAGSTARSKLGCTILPSVRKHDDVVEGIKGSEDPAMPTRAVCSKSVQYEGGHAVDRQEQHECSKVGRCSRIISTLGEKHRASRHIWAKREKEFKRCIQVFEAVMSRMERGIPPEKPASARLFNMTIRLVSCERLLNRRNNGVAFIDPFVVVYSPNGEKVLETLPRDDTDSPRFNLVEDAVTFKVVRRSPWSLTFEVFSRGCNNTRLFLGQARVPVAPLLEETVTVSELRQVVKLQPREREPDEEIVQNGHHLGTLVFSVSVAVVGSAHSGGVTLSYPDTEPECGLPGGFSSQSAREGRLARTERVEKSTSSGNLRGKDCAETRCQVEICIDSARGVRLRQCSGASYLYVVVCDGVSGGQLFFTPSVAAGDRPSWGHRQVVSIQSFSEQQDACVVFRLYAHNREGVDLFLGEASLAWRNIISGKQWHELHLSLHRGDMVDDAHVTQQRSCCLLVQCVTTATETSGAGAGLEMGMEPLPLPSPPSLVSAPSRHQLGPSESSDIIEEGEPPCKGNTLEEVSVGVYVEACSGLVSDVVGGSTFVSVIAPDSLTYLTSAVPQRSDPHWGKAEGSVTISVHPLDPGVVGFHVINHSEQSSSGELTLGYAQISVLDLFRRGFGRKKLRLGPHPGGSGVVQVEGVSSHGTITILFSPLPSPVAPSASEVGTPVFVPDTAPPSKLSTRTPSLSSSDNAGTNVGVPRAVPLRIYVKEGRGLLDCDQTIFNVLGVTDPRVMVWVGPNHVFTTPEKRDTVNPKWEPMEGQFTASVQPTHVIRFEVQDVDVAGFDSLGCAVIHASEVIGTSSERVLPVMLHGKQYGTLTVVFSTP